jgi:hypothetical protein
MNQSTGERTAGDWDKVRMDFHTSIMVDTQLTSLAQNVDAADWPLPGKEETPAKYIDLTFEELQRVPGLSGYPERIDQLIGILEDTIAFDNPFGEMVGQSTTAVVEENPLLKNLERLEIPVSFPISATILSADTQAFCKLEGIVNLADFAKFAQNMPPQVIVGGDLRTFLNALAHVNETALAAILPFRPGSKGLHLPEALGQLLDTVPAGERLALFKRCGGELTEAEAAEAATCSKQRLATIGAALQERARGVFKLFPEEIAAMPAKIAESGSLERYLVILEDPKKEMLAAKLLEPLMRPPEPSPAEARPGKAGKGGMFSRLLRWLRK